MKHIIVGSTNPTKIAAVEEIIREYPFFDGARVFAVDVTSSVSKQPLTLDETIKGAMSRAMNAFERDLGQGGIGNAYGVGLEGGLMDVPYSVTGKMNVCACSVYDGLRFFNGLSPAFEHPQAIIDLVLKEGASISEAYHRLGLTHDKTLGVREGAIGVLTKGRLARKEYEKLALRVALIHLERQYSD